MISLDNARAIQANMTFIEVYQDSENSNYFFSVFLPERDNRLLASSDLIYPTYESALDNGKRIVREIKWLNLEKDSRKLEDIISKIL